MLTQRVQGDIIPILRFLTQSTEPRAASKQIIVTFESSLPDLTMDFTPVLIRELMVNLLRKCLEFSSPSQTIEVQVDQLFPSHLTISIAVKGIGRIDLTPYRKWLSIENAEISFTLDEQSRTNFIVDFPIVNQASYWDTQQITEFIQRT